MIVCVCRNISDQDYTFEELRERLQQEDLDCGVCLQYLESIEETKVS